MRSSVSELQQGLDAESEGATEGRAEGRTEKEISESLRTLGLFSHLFPGCQACIQGKQFSAAEKWVAPKESPK